jgi:MacB-like periplasmic core domain
LGDAPDVERVWSEMVSGNFFDVLGVKPLLGRTFSAEEQAERPGGAPVAVIGETLWRRRFQADPNIAGRVIKLNQKAFTIIGVTPAAFPGTINGLNFDLWVPLMMHAELTGSWNWLEDRNSRPLALMARLRPGVDRKQADTEVSAIAKRLEAAYPRTNRNLGDRVMAMADSPDGVQSILGKLLKVLLVIGGAGFADCMRQREQSSTGASHGPAEGVRHPAELGRNPCTIVATAFHRGAGAGADRRCIGTAGR